MAFDESSSQTLSASSPQSPRSLFNSMKRLIAASNELIDSYYAEIYLRLQSIFLSISEFRQFSTNQENKFSETEKKILDSETALTGEIDKVRQEIPAIPQVTEENGWYILRNGDYVELWGAVSAALPVTFETAVAIPCGAVSGSTLTMPNETDINAVHIMGKEMKS